MSLFFAVCFISFLLFIIMNNLVFLIFSLIIVSLITYKKKEFKSYEAFFYGLCDANFFKV